MVASDSNTLACSYAALILHDEGLPINVENLNKIIKASSVEVESFWPGMFAKALSAAKVDELLATVGTASSAPAPAAAAAAPAAGGAPAKAEEKKKAPEPEEEEDMGFSLFD
uniref:60S acidic ribosomal protein P1 n=1 Tax=Cryptomonas curvata TaxID=233186 RepID=A0A7S0QIK9_9CRYP|mmetsp:Transcript_31620/g.66159  ORF Transcript_31620/g.66159 Transcript_31620/m.66159 type:complete len:112 (+) Transcript_31620:33-368(+)|eukprot:CAMPEP_0172175662 /NCGR_PEP_ID=MMETSP1050-20130122/14358_1 /TAXON_ID=233186 /ORGANISM="Cryptomonas curvata, Strain CCAP979/52" /LENGTH=111 /DNA_ID=CAMNT_0012847801 /DNA_START=13 /DNA_END=348 /DNA_ORIENTATION=+